MPYGAFTEIVSGRASLKLLEKVYKKKFKVQD
jgi:hypothetical protein